MMKQVIKLALVAIVGMTLTSCLSVNIGSGDVDTTPTQVQQINQDVAIQPFNEVGIADAFKIVYEQGSQHSVRVEASEQALKEMTVYVKDNELRIRKAVKKPTVSFKDVKVYVTSPDLKKIELAGSGMFAASSPIKAGKDMNVEIAGSGKVLLAALTSQETRLDIAGSGNIEIGNITTNDVKAEIAGSGDVNLGVLICKELNVDIAGSGNVNCSNINADEVHVDIAGSGDVNLKGTVKHHTKDIAGSGKVVIEELSPASTNN